MTFLATVKNYIRSLRQQEEKIEIAPLLAAFGIVLSLSAFIYWRILLEEFNEDYFQFCYSPEDVFYILYYKGTSLWFIAVLLSVSWLYPLLVRSSNLKAVLFTGILGLAIYVLAATDGSSTTQIILYIFLFVFISFCALYISKKAYYAYMIIIGMFFVNSAYLDAAKYKHAKLRPTIRLRTGELVLDKTDTSKFYAGRISKFILIYKKDENRLLKYGRDETLN